MPYTSYVVDEGSGPNAGDGDSLYIAFRKVNKKFYNVDAEISVQSQRIDSLFDALGEEFSGDLAGLVDRVNENKQELVTIQQELVVVKDDIENNKSDILQLTQDISSINSSLTSLENFIISLGVRLDTVEQHLQDIDSDVLDLKTNKADIDSPLFTGSPQAPTPDTSDSSQRLATTQFVKDIVAEGSAIPVTINDDGKVLTNDGSAYFWEDSVSALNTGSGTWDLGEL